MEAELAALFRRQGFRQDEEAIGEVNQGQEGGKEKRITRIAGEIQESQAGMLAAGVGKAAVSKVIAVTGKQMVNIETCEFRGGSFIVDYKYNFLAADGLYWVELQSKFAADGSGATSKVNKSSPNMAAAEAKAGVKLASN